MKGFTMAQLQILKIKKKKKKNGMTPLMPL